MASSVVNTVYQQETWQCHETRFSRDKCITIYLLQNLNSCRLEFYSLIDPKINPHVSLDMTCPPAKFDVDWLKETQIIIKKLMFDACPPNHRHPQSNNQASLSENLVNKQWGAQNAVG